MGSFCFIVNYPFERKKEIYIYKRKKERKKDGVANMFFLHFRLKNHAFEQLDAKEQRMLTLEDSLSNSVYCHLKKEMPTFPQ